MFVWSTAQAKRLLVGPRKQDKEDDQEEQPREGGQGAIRRTAAAARNLPVSCDVERGGGCEEGGRGDGMVMEEEEEEEKEEEEELKDEEEMWVGERLLDLGAGDGHVTQVLAAGSVQVDVTEASPVMRRRLRDKGYRVLDVRSWIQESGDLQYDVITCLNLLDRCDTPKTLLRDIYRKLAPDGTLVVALVLPFSPYVEYGAADNLPSEELGITGSTIEEQVNSLANEVFPSLGFQLDRWSRLPYLCEGDLDQAFYWLPDVVLVLKKMEISEDNLYSPSMQELARDVNLKLDL
ncbi:protein-L-histidine N-pros-methyltransferase-like [Penaeus japonicus]|uniref:protein-L-histidine N-pros-methyltransferase-like n=1 Tax=Penaeus japonicus TaxID=27405 RepID=UPI001C715EF3|nr:protein-L-histidine N-pros-methyltransferase-like [Penaeus japonicus]XP_042874646.1 protein-L-histidine N-pros-methyltransferase-like [Penaeus japonicus]